MSLTTFSLTFPVFFQIQLEVLDFFENTEAICWHFISVTYVRSRGTRTIICTTRKDRIVEKSRKLTAIAELLLLTKDRNELYDASLLSVFLRIAYSQLLS